jgi:hypothetical protein
MQIRSFRGSGEPAWVNALPLKCAVLFGTRSEADMSCPPLRRNAQRKAMRESASTSTGEQRRAKGE